MSEIEAHVPEYDRLSNREERMTVRDENFDPTDEAHSGGGSGGETYVESPPIGSSTTSWSRARLPHSSGNLGNGESLPVLDVVTSVRPCGRYGPVRR
jgi:hypothetical protein